MDWQSSVPILHYRGDEPYADTALHRRASSVDHVGETHYRKAYSNLSNIDWSYEYHLDHVRSLGEEWRKSMVTRFVFRHTKSIALVLVGFVIGPVAILIDVLSRSLNDVKYGLCFKDHKQITLQSRVQCGEDDWESWSTMVFKSVDGDAHPMFHYANNYLLYVVLSVVFAYMTTLIVKRQPFTKYSGISEIKIVLSGLMLNNFLTGAILVSKVVGLILVIGSGVWVGKEGPVVHIAACVAEMVAQLFPRISQNEAVRRELITASTAAGISVAFNAPVGGVLFCLEQIRTYLPIDKVMWNSFVCATVAVMMLQLVHPFADLIYGQIFQVSNESQNWLNYEIVPFMVLGIVGGFCGILFNRLNVRFAEVRSVVINHSVKLKILEVVVLTFVTALISYPFVITRVPLTELISILFADCRHRGDSENAILSSLCYETDQFPWKVIFLLLMASIQGFALAAYSYGTFIPGGVLMPSLSIGAIIGRLLGTVVEYFQFKYPHLSIFQSCSANAANCITPGSYAVVGAASFLTSVTKMSVSVVIILFELTGALNYVIPIMIGVLLSRFISDLYSDKSCYELWLQLQNYPYLRPGFDEELVKPLLSVIPCADCIKTTEEIVCIYDDELADVDSLEHYVKSYTFEGFPVLNNREDKILIGWCSRYELKLQLEQFQGYHGPLSFTKDGNLHKILSNTDYFIVSPNLSVLTLYGMFDKLSLKLAIFLKPDRELIFKSLMTKKDLIEIIELDDATLQDMYNKPEEDAELYNNNNNSNSPDLEEFIIDDSDVFPRT